MYSFSVQFMHKRYRFWYSFKTGTHRQICFAYWSISENSVGLIDIINRFLLQMLHFFSHIELKWKFGIFMYFLKNFLYTCISGPTQHNSKGEKLAREFDPPPKKKWILYLIKCHLSLWQYAWRVCKFKRRFSYCISNIDK